MLEYKDYNKQICLPNKSQLPDNLVKLAHPNSTTDYPADLLEMEPKPLF